MFIFVCCSGNYDNKSLSVNDKIMHTINNIAVMWPFALAILSLIVVIISLIICYKYSKYDFLFKLRHFMEFIGLKIKTYFYYMLCLNYEFRSKLKKRIDNLNE